MVSKYKCPTGEGIAVGKNASVGTIMPEPFGNNHTFVTDSLLHQMARHFSRNRPLTRSASRIEGLQFANMLMRLRAMVNNIVPAEARIGPTTRLASNLFEWFRARMNNH